MKNLTTLAIGLALAILLFVYANPFAAPAPVSSADSGSSTRLPDPGAAGRRGVSSGDDQRAQRTEVEAAAKPADAADAAASTADATPEDAAAKRAAECDSIVKKLHEPGLAASDQSHLWRRLAKLGLADEVIARLQKELEQRPMDSELHTMLGNAYITKMRSDNVSPTERRAASQSAMKSFDKALDLDPRNWTARFSRAMSNSSAPAFLGRKKDAIKDFETLLAQQKNTPLNKDQSHTYFFLSNLQEASGNSARAAEVRAEARELFPDDPRFNK